MSQVCEDSTFLSSSKPVQRSSVVVEAESTCWPAAGWLGRTATTAARSAARCLPVELEFRDGLAVGQRIREGTGASLTSAEFHVRERRSTGQDRTAQHSTAQPMQERVLGVGGRDAAGCSVVIRVSCEGKGSLAGRESGGVGVCKSEGASQRGKSLLARTAGTTEYSISAVAS
ncbi:uncharacterized protein MYCFIDRAFT_197741 [Pseudocercospora fijiensis CIRAD86]|uniref:Uncharacterized protein n=1 Tax=Pseudocercospora fijiensis (strain CIRAD86) TaxID=383855 RepID=M2ZP26_PSEFD|nr:uncharacterized protein MYCFIDRAFT_197741 [Pseudocercospora fijiensis CIRAD86]EME80854.1 hypothetical protein MYCFIDRAFT_197741 [Pseudocercospora fijiensis CIRAD86]